MTATPTPAADRPRHCRDGGDRRNDRRGDLMSTDTHEHDAAGCLDCDCNAAPWSSRTPCSCPPNAPDMAEMLKRRAALVREQAGAYAVAYADGLESAAAEVRAYMNADVQDSNERSLMPETEPTTAVIAAIGPAFPMYGFEGCTDRDPDHCACATSADIECAACGEVIEPGTPTFARQEGQPWLDPDHPDQDWITLWWHASCDLRTTPKPLLPEESS